jgi:hypothetical protein
MEEFFALSKDLQRAVTISGKIKHLDDNERKKEGKLREELSGISKRIAMKPALHKLLSIANFLNREAVLQTKIDSAPDRYNNGSNFNAFAKRCAASQFLNECHGSGKGGPYLIKTSTRLQLSDRAKSSSLTGLSSHLLIASRDCTCFLAERCLQRHQLETKHRTQLAAVEDFCWYNYSVDFGIT